MDQFEGSKEYWEAMAKEVGVYPVSNYEIEFVSVEGNNVFIKHVDRRGGDECT